MQAGPDAGFGPVPQPTPGRHPGATHALGGNVTPGDAVRSTYKTPARAARSEVRAAVRRATAWPASRPALRAVARDDGGDAQERGGSREATRCRRSSGTSEHAAGTPCRPRSTGTRPAVQLILKRSVGRLLPGRDEQSLKPALMAGLRLVQVVGAPPDQAVLDAGLGRCPYRHQPCPVFAGHVRAGGGVRPVWGRLCPSVGCRRRSAGRSNPGVPCMRSSCAGRRGPRECLWRTATMTASCRSRSG